MMETEYVVVRYCEKCKKNTRQRIGFQNWYKIYTQCLEKINDISCGMIHIFTLSHVGAYPFESMKPFTRVNLGIVIKKE